MSRPTQAAILTLCLTLGFTGALQAQNGSPLTSVACSAEDRLRSTNGDRATVVTFVNRSDVPVRTYWLNYSGKRVYYATIQPGGTYKQQTYVTHPWVITNSPTGDCVFIFQPTTAPSNAVIK